jgi:hypothetical protein
VATAFIPARPALVYPPVGVSPVCLEWVAGGIRDEPGRASRGAESVSTLRQASAGGPIPPDLMGSVGCSGQE